MIIYKVRDGGGRIVRTANIGINIFILAICGWLFWQTYNFSTTFAQDGMGPAYFPRIILIIIFITSLVELINSFKINNAPIIPKSKRGIAIRLLLFILVLALFINLLGIIPFVLSASISLFFLSLILKLPYLPSALISVGLSVAVYFIFTTGFNIII